MGTKFFYVTLPCAQITHTKKLRSAPEVHENIDPDPESYLQVTPQRNIGENLKTEIVFAYSSVYAATEVVLNAQGKRIIQ